MGIVLYVDISLQGHREQYLKTLMDANSASYVLLPEVSDALPQRQYLDKSGFSNHRSCISYCKWIRLISNIVKEKNVDIVHFLCGDAIYRYFGVGLNRIPAKVIVTYHHMQFNNLKVLSLRRIFKNTFCGIVHTLHLKNRLDEIGIDNAVVIDYPVFMKDSTTTKEEAKAKFALPLDTPCFVIIGTQYYKGLDILLEALKKVDKPYVLYITGPERAFSEEYIKENTVGNENIRINLGNLSDEDYQDAIIATDYMILPYRKEFDGASGPMTDAIWHRKCIIGSEHGSMGSLISSYKLGTVFKSEDPASLAEAINKVLTEKLEWNSKCEKFRNKLTVSEFINKNQIIYSKTKKNQVANIDWE